ncbi:MAG: hypothetical protein ACI9SE_002673 [Neolewinella sp.]|jgi:hypothetical protein
MIIGQTINSLDKEGDVAKFFSPWFPRQDDNARFAYERIHSTLDSPETVEVFSKRSEDSGDSPGSVVATFAGLGATGFFEASCFDLKDMVRFRVTIAIEEDPGWLHFRFLEPTWFATARV